MPLSERDNEQIHMAVAVLTAWINHPNAGTGTATDDVIRRYAQDEPGARLQMLRGLVPVAGSMVRALANVRGVPAQQALEEALDEAGLWLRRQADE